MTLDVFWQRIESAIMDYGECDVCPVNEYAKETNTERMCDKVCDCADGLMMLHKKLQDEERQRMTENKTDTPKRKSLVWLDGEEVKVMDCGYDWHTNVKPQMIVKGERGEDGRE